MKKIVTLLAACVAIILASCAQPSTSGSGVGGGGSSEAETVIFDTAKEITWSDFVIVSSDKFTGSEPKTISIYYDCVTVKGQETSYTSMKIAGNYSGVSIGDGKVTGASLKNDDKGALEGTGTVGESGKIITYLPTEDEWATLSGGEQTGDTPNGLYINGNCIKITKITLK